MKSENSQIEFSKVDIYYNYAFDLGQPVNPVDAARLLLKTGLGQAFQNYFTGQPEIADKYKPYLDELEKKREIRKAPNTVETDKSEIEGRKSPEALTDLGKFVANLLGLRATHEHVDREIFDETYVLAFARVELQPFGAKVRGELVDFDVSLTIHRSGIAILTAYGLFNGPMTLQEIVKLRGFRKLSVPECVIWAPAFARYKDLNKDSPGIRVHVEKPEGALPSDRSGYTRLIGKSELEFWGVFDIYRCFVIESIHGETYSSKEELEQSVRTSNWYGYPVVFIKKMEPHYSSGKPFKEAHSEVLAKLVLGWDNPSPLKRETIAKICDDDLSVTDDYSLYLTEGGGTVVYYENYAREIPPAISGLEWLRQKFLTTVVVDILLLQKAIISTFNFQIGQATYDLDELYSLKRDYILALNEFEVLGIT